LPLRELVLVSSACGVRKKGELVNKEIFTFPNVPNRHN
jgi:hypothetical protein